MPEVPGRWRDTWRERVSGGAAVYAIAFRSTPLALTVVSLLTVAQLATSQGFALGLKFLTDGVASRDERLAAWGVGLFAAVLGFGAIANLGTFATRMRIREKTSHAIDQQLMQLAGAPPTLEHFERPDYADRMQLLRDTRMELGAVPDVMTINVAILVQVGLGLGVLSTAHPALVALPLFGIPALVVNQRNTVAQQALQRELAENTRTRGHLWEVAISPIAGKELRIFGLVSHLADRREALWDTAEKRTVNLAMRAGLQSALTWMFFAAAYVGGVLLVARDAVAGRASPGDVVLTVTLAGQVRGYVQQLLGVVQQTSAILISAERYAWLRTFAREALGRAQPLKPMPVPTRLRDGITFEQVTFAYPGTENEVLEAVDLHLPAGSTVALVGDNGAGKTTLVKLLGRYYDPTSGRVLVDGVDLRDFPPDEWRSRLSGAFQDYARFELAARHVVGVGDLSRLDDEHAVRTALGRAAADDLEANLPDGLSTLVGRSFQGGVELSGGQWQKLALGRALLREQPLLLLLDEPTANLDALAEHELFERYAGAAREAGTTSGAITLLVSHRFSTVRMADLIVVLGQRGIDEFGTHEDLMARRGTYAELYELQARAYR